VGVEDEQLLIDPPIAGRRSLSFSEIEKYWSGQALFLWRDSLNLLRSASPGSKGDRVKQLQSLLKEAGAYNKPLTGVIMPIPFRLSRNFRRQRELNKTVSSAAKH